MHQKKVSKAEDTGSVLLIIMFLMAILSIIAVMGYKTGGLEISLAGNEKCTAILKLNAESSALTASQLLENIINESFISVSTNTDPDADARRIIDTSWNNTLRPAWLHKGRNDCIGSPGNLRNGDINNDGKITSDDGNTRIKRARAFSQNFYLNDINMKDNWSIESSCNLRDSMGRPVTSMGNAKYMVVEYGVAASESIATGLTPTVKRKNYLISGVDEKCNGKYMIQIGYSNLVPVSD